MVCLSNFVQLCRNELEKIREALVFRKLHTSTYYKAEMWCFTIYERNA